MPAALLIMANSTSPPSVMHSASSSMSRRNYGVFLSFRGPDCRNTIVSHLYDALCQNGVNVFKDNEELEAGQRRSELFEAIEGSRIAIVMFSENYARSRWCLDELKKIMDCRDQGKLDVLPIFYRVSPGEVRLHEKPNGDKGCYQAAIEEMQVKYGKDSEMVKGWRKALWQGGDMIGIPLSLGQDEGSVVQEIVRKVSKKLNRFPLEVAKYPVGIDRKLEEVRPLLHLDPHESNVYMIGIAGEGGIGKTTISKAICNDVADRFDDWCFLRNVRESSRDARGLALLQQELLRKLLSDEHLTVQSVDAGIPMIKERLCNKRVLIILDDVDELAQLDALAGSRSWFGKGKGIQGTEVC
ncbi:hypothetical protein MLD38_031438 [Melastoma candidum]|uniref:Uncharacterized protein n=1 Tax=Melastoma candidum TaxID=119954 RepID=A0ACB9MPP9_9MYRT|nr:hypothetical protein MLD38_031438 [Melastoma candidum]